MHAEKCPICEGKGKVTIDDYGNIVTLGKLGGKCHGCDGRGWVPVPDNPILREAQCTAEYDCGACNGSGCPMCNYAGRIQVPFAIHSHPVEVLEAVPSETKCSHPGDTLYTGGCEAGRGKENNEY